VAVTVEGVTVEGVTVEEVTVEEVSRAPSRPGPAARPSGSVGRPAADGHGEVRGSHSLPAYVVRQYVVRQRIRPIVNASFHFCGFR
jgi:hypothetical protein